MSYFYLRHKDTDVAVMQLDSDGYPESTTILKEDELPILGTGKIKNINEWMLNRAIPSGRRDLEKLLKETGCKNPNELLMRNFALSLSDCYWICPIELPEITWEQVNLFSHTDKVYGFRSGSSDEEHLIHSNSVVNGSLPKIAVYHDNKWFLRKQDNKKTPFGLLNINEAFASLIHKEQGNISYVTYTVNMDQHGVAASCECEYFTDAKHELISAYNVTGGLTGQSYNGKKCLEEFIYTCVENGLEQSYVQSYLDYMFMTDFLITNTDRHWENFGILRNPDTLKFESMAPIFDNGTSMVNDNPYVKTRAGLLRIEGNNILKQQEELVKLVSNKNIVNINRLPAINDVVSFYEAHGVPEDLAKQIAQCYGFKLDMVLELQHGYTISVDNEYLYDLEPPFKDGQKNPQYIKTTERVGKNNGENKKSI